jgi:hypothetical protein
MSQFGEGQEEFAEEMRHPGHRPPHRPPNGDDTIERLRETVEVQARTIRYLLSNYEALLRKVERGEHEREERVEYHLGAARSFQTGHVIPSGWWIPLTTARIRWPNRQGGWHEHSDVPAFDPIFSCGKAEARSTFNMEPILTRIVQIHEDEHRPPGGFPPPPRPPERDDD